MTQPQTQTVTVYILDKEYHVVCPVEERSNLERAAAYLDGKMREIRRSGKVIGAERIAVLAALNITHDLQHRTRQLEEVSDVNGEQMQQLMAQLGQALADT
jgi:cell division protein ZapA